MGVQNLIDRADLSELEGLEPGSPFASERLAVSKSPILSAGGNDRAQIKLKLAELLSRLAGIIGADELLDALTGVQEKSRPGSARNLASGRVSADRKNDVAGSSRHAGSARRAGKKAGVA